VKGVLCGGYDEYAPQNYMFLLQNIVSFMGFFAEETYNFTPPISSGTRGGEFPKITGVVGDYHQHRAEMFMIHVTHTNESCIPPPPKKKRVVGDYNQYRAEVLTSHVTHTNKSCNTLQ